MRATSVAKYQPPERISAALPSAITTPSPSSTTRWANAGGELDVMGGDDDAGAAAGQALDQLDQIAPGVPGPCRASAHRAPQDQEAHPPPSARLARLPMPSAVSRRRTGHADPNRPCAPVRLSATPPFPRLPVAHPPLSPAPGNHLGSESAGRYHSALLSCLRIGSARPASVLNRVLFPAPLRPIRATRSPRSDLRSIPLQHVAPRLSVAQLDPEASDLAATPPGGPGVPGVSRRDRRPRQATDAGFSRGTPVPCHGRGGWSLRLGHLRGEVRCQRVRRGARLESPGRCRLAGPRPRKSLGEPSKATEPESMAMTRSAAARQRSRRCSARRIDTPHSSFSRRRSQISSSPATGSSWEVGSSNRTSLGRVTRAAASATRWSSPPERVSTVRPSRCGIASARATSSIARAREARGVAAHLQR